jgi:hypothetical protein
MKKVHLLLDYLEAQAINYAKINTTISAANIGWHSIHSCLVINSIISTLLKSDPSNFKKKFSLKAYLVLLLNKFPRGKAKAPSFTMPTYEINTDSVLYNIAQSRQQITLLITAQKNQYFTHPIFGNLNLPQTIQFLGVHTHHHVKIIKDILK